MATFGGGTGGPFGSSITTQPQTQQPGQSGGLFAGMNSSTNAATGSGSGQAAPATQPSLFGSQPMAGSTPGTGLFGAGNTGTYKQAAAVGASLARSGGLFGGGSGTTQNQPQTGGGLFGGGSGTTQHQSQPGGGLFGSTTTAPQNQPQAGGSGSGLFGGSGATTTQNQPQTGGGGLFGNTTATGQTGVAGTQPATGGLFAAANQAAAAASIGGLFGNTGASTASQPTGSLFGSTAQQPATGGGLFGSATSIQQQPATGGGGGLFGSSTTQQQQPTTTGGGLFGSTTGQQQPATGGGLFGSSVAQTGSQSTLFGSSSAPGTGLFGNASAGPTGAGGTSNLFGGLTAQQPVSGLLGGSLFSTTPSSTPAQNQTDPQTQFAQLQQRIEAIVGAWSPASPLNRFQHYFYNLVDPSQVHLYGRPATATDESLWQKAVRENPDPTCLVPVLATSFDDLQKRVEAQTQQATAHQEKLKEIRARIEKLSERHALTNAPRLQKLASAQAQLTHRLLRLVQHLHLLIPALRSSSIRPEEEVLRAALEEIDGEIRRPGGMGRIVGKLNELWALVGAVNAMRGANSKGSTDGVEWAVVDEEGLNQIVQILGEEQAGLAHLTKILQRDRRDIGVIYGEEMGEDLMTI
ncbi:nucleoporin complex subunit 54-domain-containing protein [Lactifluus volemus]|nr:nucleoporin complex subunit 54-domain-containing protein [Lactifluus volemus]